ncbi:PD-(D/E)XK nuclease superfamily protein [Gemmata obscuriglobus]|uniref:Dna2/Cas4 domain-containing protein n=1 Tax=Gemmata obscuriglobus TaxID=114 RepID=A0A2Z3H838_9BACT|nr:Dna2/Cas4 domain-containing protein [Gemmata obscuriglobus]AWM39155.1 Dna2/Cas4 domain-containing protein [Gemmata obscuriglobus]QEG27799.1 PD-(D/E)XK nuclease superfamily protein [Gemmata obscuriglobus]VTS05124.1 RecB family exonuclease OS=Singulisphaera acidiphila (strain ATCC BAA-1392 / DSM 18658 / VKM B-2454 / MOB10) GN=Sinac_7681 PE=4 SV=1: Cas_Cas4 [Gemmata obscuriglobus UQM 2246]
MHPVFLLAAAIGLLGIVLLLFAAWGRRVRGLGAGETVALDNVTLVSSKHRLVGRPDRVVKQGDALIPEEWKSARRVSHGHRLQLGTYFILIEAEYGLRPPHGVIVLGDGSRVTVANTEALRAEVLATAAKIRAQRRHLMSPVPVDQPKAKCGACGQRGNCTQAKA